MLKCHVVHCLNMLSCSLYRREATELWERKWGLKRECFAFCLEREKFHRGLRNKHVLQHESNSNAPKKQDLRYPDSRDEIYSNVNSFGTTKIFLPKDFQRAWTMKSNDLTGQLGGQTTCILNFKERD